jgi:hypothetical protein
MKLYDVSYVRWQYEDELPEDLTTSDYNAIYPFSRKKGVALEFTKTLHAELDDD